ncbi:hypothetical protein KPP23_047 [Pseudomonas phage KPP23]|nr:hypothetical protein KPP23_047 [Pseudomonas phage KPP23]
MQSTTRVNAELLAAETQLRHALSGEPIPASATKKTFRVILGGFEIATGVIREFRSEQTAFTFEQALRQAVKRAEAQGFHATRVIR